MDYHRYITHLAERPWAIHPAKADVIAALMHERASGYRPTADEIRSRLGHDGVPHPEVQYLAAVPSGAAGGDLRRGNRIVVLPIHGIIAHRGTAFELSSGGTAAEWIKATAARLTEDDSVLAVILDIDSPGGSTEGIQTAGDALFNLRRKKPVTAISNSMMASAAYWLGSQAHEIVVEPGGGAGSIGVFMIGFDFSKKLEKDGIGVNLIKFGANKIEGHPYEPMSDETRAHNQHDVNRIGAQFHAAIARGRGISVEQVAGFGAGRYFMAEDAVARGLADRIATLDQVITEIVAGRLPSERRGGRASVALSHSTGGVAAARAQQVAMELELELLDQRPSVSLGAAPAATGSCATPAPFVFEGCAVPYGQKGTGGEFGLLRIYERGACAKYVASGAKPPVWVNHDKTQVIGGTFERLVSEDDGFSGGLMFRFRPDDTPAARRLRDEAASRFGSLPVSIAPIRADRQQKDPYHRIYGTPVYNAEVYDDVSIGEISLLTGDTSPAFNGAVCTLVEDEP